jgi:dTDP-4-dehydro-6-deoxy-alpha-D-glucopyranose 2,3-dehydratase
MPGSPRRGGGRPDMPQSREPARSAAVLCTEDSTVARDLARSAAAPASASSPCGWLRERDRVTGMSVSRVDLAGLRGWRTDPHGALRHESGRFFAVVGVEACAVAAVPRWSQPIIHQPEVGILGILATRVDGTVRLLMQAKDEPGNPHGSELSPTVQATRSNFTGAHGGRAVPYLDAFRLRADKRAWVDVRQSEQGSWFLGKRNRNMVVEVEAETDARDGFAWFTVGEVFRALTADSLVNMDARTVLSCLPLRGPGVAGSLPTADEGFSGALARSIVGSDGAAHRTTELLAALTRERSESEATVIQVPLTDLPGWQRQAGAISRLDGAFFEVVGVEVQTAGREVASWSQPMIAGLPGGISCFLVTPIRGVLHVLIALRVELGFVDVAEFGPTVQCAPGNYDHLPSAARPRFLDDVLTAPPNRVRFSSTLSEEGGRFLDTCTRYLIVETDSTDEPPGFRWMTVDQLVGLVAHSHYVNVQARTLLLCLQSLAFADASAG